jgi:hypothetical protein
VSVTVDPSTAMFFTEAESKLIAPSMSLVTEVFLTEMLDFDCVSLATRVATVLVAKLSDLLTALVEAGLSAVAKFLLLALLED